MKHILDQVTCLAIAACIVGWSRAGVCATAADVVYETEDPFDGLFGIIGFVVAGVLGFGLAIAILRTGRF